MISLPSAALGSSMRILVLGGDGYLGWPTALHLSESGHEVGIADNFVRRQYDHELGVESLVPIEPLAVRGAPSHEVSRRRVEAWARGLFATDLNQGVVDGQQTDETARDERLATRFDYDAVFGTVLNRFVILAALGQPLTVYGDGGQTRGLIDIRDTAQCIRLAAENPAERGEFRVFNQMTEAMSVLDIAKLVADLHPNAVDVEHLDNPRVEAESHYYRVSHTGLVELGLKPHLLSDTLLTSLYAVAERYKHRADLAALRPAVRWRLDAAR